MEAVFGRARMDYCLDGIERSRRSGVAKALMISSVELQKAFPASHITSLCDFGMSIDPGPFAAFKGRALQAVICELPTPQLGQGEAKRSVVDALKARARSTK
jgi:hypothetical protein